jgi:integrase
MITTSKAGRKFGTTGQAQVLSEKEVKQILKVIAVGNNAYRNTSIVILSHYLGLRENEVAALKVRRWSNQKDFTIGCCLHQRQ